MPQDILPRSVYEEVRKCSRCRKEKVFLKTENFKTCSECRKSARSYKHRHTPLKLSAEDLKLMEQENARKTRELALKFGTDKPDCLEWRNQFSKGQKSDFLYNHIQTCLSCCGWYARNKHDTLDLNNVGKGEDFPELKGWSEVFGEKKPFAEDFVYRDGVAFPLNSICPIHGCALGKNGCPVCNGEQDA